MPGCCPCRDPCSHEGQRSVPRARAATSRCTGRRRRPSAGQSGDLPHLSLWLLLEQGVSPTLCSSSIFNVCIMLNGRGGLWCSSWFYFRNAAKTAARRHWPLLPGLWPTPRSSRTVHAARGTRASSQAPCRWDALSSTHPASYLAVRSFVKSCRL